MSQRLAVAAVLIGVSVGSVAYGADPIVPFDVSPHGLKCCKGEHSADERLTDAGADGLWDSPGDDTFFDVFAEGLIIDGGGEILRSSGFCQIEETIDTFRWPGFLEWLLMGQ